MILFIDFVAGLVTGCFLWHLLGKIHWDGD